MENEETPIQPIPDTSPQGEVSPDPVTDQSVPTPTAQIPADEPLGSSTPEPVEQSADSAPVSVEPILSPTPNTNIIRELLAKARAKIQSRKRLKLDHILTLFAKRTHITNDEVEKLLHVSDATATRYLESLEKENKIKKIGKTGKYTRYEKV